MQDQGRDTVSYWWVLPSFLCAVAIVGLAMSAQAALIVLGIGSGGYVLATAWLRRKARQRGEL